MINVYLFEVLFGGGGREVGWTLAVGLGFGSSLLGAAGVQNLISRRTHNGMRNMNCISVSGCKCSRMMADEAIIQHHCKILSTKVFYWDAIEFLYRFDFTRHFAENLSIFGGKCLQGYFCSAHLIYWYIPLQHHHIRSQTSSPSFWSYNLSWW